MSQLTIAGLTVLAERDLTENGFLPKAPPEVVRAAQTLETKQSEFAADSSIRDLRSLLWSSIDNATSRDLDQVEYAEELSNGDIRLLVGIADVDAFVPKDSVIDRFAAQNTVSVYTAGKTFPMLPEQISNDLSSLLDGQDRLAVVIEMTVTADGSIGSTDIYRAFLHNYAKLSYEEIGEWLDGNGTVPESFAAIPGLEAQIRLQQKTAARLMELRKQNGALQFETIEAEPVIVGGKITDIKIVKTNSARSIIENFMVATNVEMAKFLENRNVASIRRVVETPERWNRIVEIAASFGEKLPYSPDSVALADFLARRKAADPTHYPDLSLSIIKLLGSGEYVMQETDADAGGHFGLAVNDYTHSTAPNRRYADLIVQRLVKAVIANEPAPYTVEELQIIAKRCSERESAAKKVERQMRKTIAASVMAGRIGEEFEAIVTGTTPRGTFARIINPPVDGRIVKNEEELEVGEKVAVRLLAVEPERGFIDFAYLS